MVSKGLLKAYEFESIDDYYEFILNSYINGQFQQQETLIKQLGKQQKKEFLSWLELSYYHGTAIRESKIITLKHL